MNIRVIAQGDTKIAVTESRDIVLASVQNALDLMSAAWYENGCSALILRQSNVAEDFFQLKSGLAGEVLQKFTNYQMKLAIVGDFSGYNSKSLKDFIFESNKGGEILFVEDEMEAAKVFFANAY